VCLYKAYVCLCEVFENFKVQVKRGIFVITENLGLFLQNVFGWKVILK
jgi:hypothetical protein